MAHSDAAASFSCISKEQSLWWEEEFYSGKLVCLPDGTFDTDATSTSGQLYYTSVISDELRTFAPNAHDQLQGFDLSKKVPILVNLCISRVLSLFDNHDDAVVSGIPPGLAPLVKRHQERGRLEHIRLKWLLNALIHQDMDLTFHLYSHSGLPLPTQTTKKLYIRRCRPAWETDSRARNYIHYRGDMFPFNEESWWYIPVAVEGRDVSDWSIAALAHAIQLMLPHRLILQDPDSSTESGETLREALRKELESAVNRVKYALNKVCPKLVHDCFDPALAYVWWGRGDISNAEEMFLRIVGQMPSDSALIDETGMARDRSLWTRQKSLYLNEIGRLHTYFNQPQEAAKFYQEAIDLSTRLFPQSVPDCVMQGLMLKSTAYDQGLMDNLKAINAAGLWDAVTSEPGCHPNLFQMAAESFLHCHTGYLTTSDSPTGDQNTAWLLEARFRLRALATTVSKVNLHLSLILAMLGEDTAAEDSYMDYVQEYASHHPAFQQRIPGAVPVFIGAEIKPHPWWVLSEWTSNTKGSETATTSEHLMALPLLWRRTLRHCSCDVETVVGNHYHSNWTTPHSQVADVQGIDIYLRLTQDGFLTGSLSQNLPPLTSVLLDPYTGRICLPEQFRDVDTLPCSNYQYIHGGSDVDEYSFNFDTFVPTPVLIYDSLKDGRTVSLLTWQHREAFGRKDTSGSEALLIYSGCDGKCVVNIDEAVMRAKKESILQQLINEGYDKNPVSMEDASDFLDFCILKSRTMKYDFLKAALDGETLERNTLLFAKMHLGKTPASCSGSEQVTWKQLKNFQHRGKHELQAQELVLQRVILVGKSTTVLALYTAASQDYSARRIDTLVFVDCSNFETFKKPVIQYPERPYSVWNLPRKDGYGNYSVTGGNIFIATEVSVRTNKERLFIFNDKGQVIHIHDKLSLGVVSHAGTRKEGDSDIVIHTSHNESRLQSMDTKGTVQSQTKPLGKIEDFLTAYNMVFVALRDRILILDSGTLDPVEIVRNQIHPTTKHGSSQQPVVNPAGTGVLLTGERSFMKVLSTCESTSVSSSDEEVDYFRVILGLANNVFVLQRDKQAHRSTDPSVSTTPTPVTVMVAVVVPGIPTEARYISQSAGFVVTASIFESPNLPMYRENLYWFDGNGNIRGIHPFLGPGPHGLYAVHLQEPITKSKNALELSIEERGLLTKQWYLYFTDGLGAICCIKLNEDLF